MATVPNKEVHISRGAYAARSVRPQSVANEQDTPRKHMRLGELLIEEAVITPEQLEAGLEYQARHQCFLGKALVDLEILDQDTLITFLVKQTNIPHLNLTDYQIQRDVLEIMPVDFCRKHQVIPIDRMGTMLTVALVDPLDLVSLEAVRAAFPDFRIKPMLCSWQHLDIVLSRREPQPEVFHDPLGIAPANEAGPVAPEAEIQHSEGRDHEPAAVEERNEDRDSSDVIESAEITNDIVLPQSDISSAVAEALRPVVEDVNSAWIDAFFGDDEAEHDDRPIEKALTEPPLAASDAIADEGSADDEREPIPAPIESDTDEPGSVDLAAVVRDSIRDAVGMVAQAIRERGDDRPPSAQELAGSLRGAVYTAIKGLGEHESSGTVLDAVGNDFPEIQAATQRALRDAEAVVVAEARLHELESAHRRKHIPFTLPRYHSVHSFGNPEQACLTQDEDDIVLSALESEQPLQEFRFDDFFVDKSNAFTFSLCRAVAEKPGCDYNPFFLYGSVGVGKTHLVNAIGNFIQSRDQDSRVGYVSAIFFASRLSDAVQDGAVKVFRDNYCHWDVLILDDMQFLAGRVDAQEEFFHIFNALHQSGRQIIIAGDQAPDRLGLLEERLVSRFSGGIVAHLRPPNYETRLAILRHHVRLRDAAVPEDVLMYLANHVTNDVRKLTGSLRKVLAFADLVGQDITLEMATEILGHLGVAAAV